MSLVMPSRRSVMTLFTNKLCPYSHRVRFVMAEKGITPEIVEVNLKDKPAELIELNPYGQAPTLVDRDLVLYESRIIIEYLEDRFPHPPLMPMYPIAKGRTRLMLFRIERDWYALMHKILTNSKSADAARKELSDSLLAVTPIFAEYPYFLSEEFSIVDCSLSVLLWRLPLMGITLPPHAKAIREYAKKIFDRPAFRASLSRAEEEIEQPF